MKWFGKPGGAPYESDAPHVPTPVGERCLWCDEAIVAGDDGTLVPYCTAGAPPVLRPYHYECQLRSVIGGVNHLQRKCICCGGTLPPDPPEMSRREAAKAAVALWRWGTRYKQTVTAADQWRPPRRKLE